MSLINPSPNRGILCRPRINALIGEGLRHPLLVMLAGPGYGKTQAMTDYLAQTDAQVFWLRLSNLDNLPSHFWNHLTRTVQRVSPELAESLESFGFPDSVQGFETFEQQIIKESSQKQIICVFDDYGEINDPGIKGFVRMLVDAEIPNFHLALLSNALYSLESTAFMTQKRFLVLTDDLRFIPEEITGLYNLYGIMLDPAELDAIEQYTEGWPLALHLLATQRQGMVGPMPPEGRLTHDGISYIFEERFFSAYPKEQQKLLVKLSLLDFFTKEFAIDLYEGEKVELEHLGNHAFLKNEPSTGRFFFHYLYRTFLQQKQYLLDDEEKREVWQKAAIYYLEEENFMEAVVCFQKADDHMGMLEVITDVVMSVDISAAKNAVFFLEHLDLLTPEEMNSNPVAGIVQAMLYSNILMIDKAEALLSGLEQQLLNSGTEEDLSLLGEVYAVEGTIHMIRAQDDFDSSFEKAAKYLPDGSRYKERSMLRIQNANLFAMSDNLPGAKERMENAVHRGAPWMISVLGSSMNGFEHVFMAESAYLSYRLKDAQQHAYRAVYGAEEQCGQHDAVCNAYFLLARIAFIQGNLAEMTKQIEALDEYVGSNNNAGIIRDIRDTALAWYYVQLQDYAHIPKSIATMNTVNNPVTRYTRSLVVYADYLISTEDYARLIGMLEQMTSKLFSNGVWMDGISMCILLSVSYYHLGNTEAAMGVLHRAYLMSHDNGLITPFIEAGRHMRALVGAAKEQDKYKFSPEWLDLINRHVVSFSKRANALRALYQKQNPSVTAKDNPLSKREQEILQSIAQGLTREEISLKCDISVNTVKSTIGNIFSKLGATNRGDAIAIAITNGYIGGYTPE